MEWLIVITIVLSLALVLLFMNYLEEVRDRKWYEEINTDYEFCIKCIGQLNESEMYLSVLVYGWEMNPSRSSIFHKMGYRVTEERDSINPIVHPPLRIQRIKVIVEKLGNEKG